MGMEGKGKEHIAHRLVEESHIFLHFHINFIFIKCIAETLNENIFYSVTS